MTKKLFTLLLAVTASVGTMFAVTIDGLNYNLNDELQTAEVAENSGASGDIIIPSTVAFNSVTYSVTSIGEDAFRNCTGLTSVTIPNSVTRIEFGAFWGCSGLISVTIPNSVTRIGSSAFSGCSVLTSVTIPNSVTSIGNEAFKGCTGLTSPVYNAHVFAFMPTSYSGAYTIPDGIESIVGGAFRGCSGLTSVTIPNSVTSIGNNAFFDCSGLTSVTIPNSVTSIGDRAFYGCSGLTSVTIPNSVTSIGWAAFHGCSGLTSVTIPNSVTSIGESAFAVCSNLKSLKVLNPNVKYSGEMPIAYYQMDSLRTIIVPAQCLPINPEFTTAYAYYYPQQLDTIEIIGGELSKEAWWMISLSRKTLQSVDLSGTAHTDLADEAFKEFYNLQKLILPANLTHIGYKSVAECVKLQSIDIPASVEEIDDRAFEDCRSIQTITFGGSANPAPGRFNAPAAASQLKRIGNWAFYNAHELQNLEIPEGVTEIGDGAFYGCTYLEDLTLPSSVQAIGDNCFALCSKLTKIIINSVTPPAIQAKTFYDVKRQIPVYVPDEAVSAYEGDTYWQEFDIQGQQAPQGVDNIDSSSLQGGDRGRLILHNGQIFILRGDHTYTLTGQEVR